MQFRSVLEGKTGKEIPESSRLEFLEKFLANNFALSDAEDNTYGPLNRGGTADLPLLRTLLAIRQKSREPRFMCKFGSFKNPALALKLIELQTYTRRIISKARFAEYLQNLPRRESLIHSRIQTS